MEWQRQNKASVHRTAKEFADDRKRVCEWCQCYSTLKGQTRGVLGKRRCLHCGQPPSVSGGQEKRRQISVELASVTVCNITFLCQHLGVALEEGVYLRDKMSDPAYEPPNAFA